MTDPKIIEVDRAGRTYPPPFELRVRDAKTGEVTEYRGWEFPEFASAVAADGIKVEFDEEIGIMWATVPADDASERPAPNPTKSYTRRMG